MFFKKSMKTLVIVVLALTMAGFSYAFAAANTMPPASHSGDGAVAISGYTVTAISYTLGTPDPTSITAVTFTLDAAANKVQISLNGGTPWTLCTNSSGFNWTCPVSTTVTAATSLRVVASD